MADGNSARAGRSNPLVLFSLLACLLGYALLSVQLRTLPRETDEGGLRVALPGVAQLLFAGGDRHLAANINVFRAMMVGHQVKDPAVFALQARLQQQASILNPYHEDNYYLAAAILSWEGQVGAAQWILTRATEYRHWDFLAPFFAGFNAYHFDRDGIAAGDYASLAADRLQGAQSLAMRDIAAKWYGASSDLREAVYILEAMANATPDPRMRQRLMARKLRTEQLLSLRQAAAQYREKLGKKPQSLDALIERGLITAVPEDPFRQGFVIDGSGLPQFKPRSQVKRAES